MTPAKVAGLTDDKETRKVINNMIRGLVSGEPVSKKRGRDSDLLQPLKKDEEEEDTPIDMSFQFVTEREVGASRELTPWQLPPDSITATSRY